MKKGLLILIFFGLTLPLLISAQTHIVIHNPIHSHTFDELIGKIMNFIWRIALALIPLMIVIAGFYFVTAAGDPAKVKNAQGIILYTVIGFIIILLARGLVELLKTIL